MPTADSQSRTSASLLARVAGAEDDIADRIFVARYGDLVRKLATSRSLPHQDVEDVVQEVMFAVVRILREDRYDPERGRFKSFIKAIIFNKIADALGSASRSSADPRVSSIVGSDSSEFPTPAERSPRSTSGHSELGTLCDPRPTPAEAFEAAFDAEWRKLAFEEALDEVRLEVEPVTFQAFDLVARKGRPASEVARLLGVKKSVVYTARSRVLARISDKLRTLAAD